MIHSPSRIAPHVDSAHEESLAAYKLERGFPDLDTGATRRARLSRREQQIINLFLEGYENIDIARRLGIAHRTVKACFNRLYLRFGITSGIKRVKLATLLYRRRLCSEVTSENNAHPTEGTASSLFPARSSMGNRSPRGESEPRERGRMFISRT
jgi:DNA-binding CsgD family transcriptional regulator